MPRKVVSFDFKFSLSLTNELNKLLTRCTKLPSESNVARERIGPEGDINYLCAQWACWQAARARAHLAGRLLAARRVIETCLVSWLAGRRQAWPNKSIRDGERATREKEKER